MEKAAANHVDKALRGAKDARAKATAAQAQARGTRTRASFHAMTTCGATAAEVMHASTPMFLRKKRNGWASSRRPRVAVKVQRVAQLLPRRRQEQPQEEQSPQHQRTPRAVRSRRRPCTGRRMELPRHLPRRPCPHSCDKLLTNADVGTRPRRRWAAVVTRPRWPLLSSLLLQQWWHQQ